MLGEAKSTTVRHELVSDNNFSFY